MNKNPISPWLAFCLGVSIAAGQPSLQSDSSRAVDDVFAVPVTGVTVLPSRQVAKPGEAAWFSASWAKQPGDTVIWKKGLTAVTGQTVTPSVFPAQTLEVFTPFPGRILSVSQPVVPEDFVFLKDQGIKLIVSVDGAKPDVAAAKKLGMGSIHLPISYDGVPQETQAALSNVLKEDPGKIFIHCHHGKHRGPAAAMLDGCATKVQNFPAATRHFETLAAACLACRQEHRN
ncbi:MAG: hypothetical protein NTW21_32925 [Verrucomicrobia bacterium]|nr:hypothetical protein [Verrucomicrobiota bacterium]